MFNFHPLVSTMTHYSYRAAHGGGWALVSQSTATDAGAVANDIAILTRSVKMNPITLGAGEIIQGVDPIDLISTWLQARLVETGTGTSFWHSIVTLNLSQVVWGKFTDPVTGQTFTIYSGEEITVYDANGWSLKVQWTPSVAGQPWQIVPGSVRDNHGNKVNMVNNVPTTPAPVSGSTEPSALTSIAPGVSWNPVILTPFNDGLPKGQITVCPDGCPGIDGGGGGDGDLTDTPDPL
jgi:hypothetical protein